MADPSGEAASLGRAQVAGSRWEATVAGRRARRDWSVRRALATADMLAITFALGVAFVIGPWHAVADVVWLLPVLPAWVVLFAVYGLYARDVKRINHGVLDDVPRLFHALVIGTLGLWAYYRVLPIAPLVLAEVVAFGAASIVFVLALRWLARHLIASSFGPERVLLVGQAPVTPALVRKIRRHPEYGLEPVGLVSLNGAARNKGSGNGASGPPPSLPVLDVPADAGLAEVISRHGVERIIVAQDEVDDDLMLDLCRQCGRLQVKVSVLPRGVETMGPSMEVDEIEGVAVLGLNPLVLSRSSRALKRAMDVFGAGLGLLLLSPLIALVALAVKLDSRGPVLFRQARVGRGGGDFRLLKFRTMVPDAEPRVAELMGHSQDPHWLKLERDPRVTRVGRVLRRFSIDELPQLWNVLTGRMSLVGPRPLTPTEHTMIAEWGWIRLDLAPGITGLWQVLGRTSIPFEEMVKLDYVYVTNWSLPTDLILLLKTLPAVVARRGAN
jgi:exopolysaccharide biosynthesis polyprenyl glycosylphosphotransferase